MSGAVPPFPGAVAVTRLHVYGSESPDGLRGGTPHVHLLSTEAYLVLAGRGRVQTLGPAGFAETALEPDGLVWFTPGVIHRLVNDDGRLDLLVLMQDAGLPEAGDMVITFPQEILADAAAYAAAATLPPGERTTAGSGAAARTRRDRGMLGFMQLKEAVAADGPAALDAFYRAAAALVRPRIPQWRTLCEQGPAALVQQTAEWLTALERGDASHLQRAGLYVHGPQPGEHLLGCCGTLQPYRAE